MKKITPIIVALCIASIALGAPKAEASTLESAVKNLDSSLNQLVTAKDEISSDNQLTPEEDLAFRKKVVNDALILSLKEIEDIKGKLNAFKFNDKSAEETLKKQYLGNLGEFEGYYRDLQGKLDKENDVEVIKEIARTAKTYHEETYSPAISKILDFILAFQTDKLVSSADARYVKIDADIKKLEKANFIEPGYFGRQMGESKKLISDARGLVDKAKTAVTTIDDEKEPVQADTDTVKKASSTPRELCEAALVNLKSGYNIFVDISTAVKKILKI